MNVEISKHTKDLIQKHTAALLRDIMPEFYGIKVGKVRELINPELPEVKLGGGGTDIVFLTDDDKYFHLGFETGSDKGDILKHLNYDSRLMQRDRREVITVIIYTADVAEALPGINGETLVYNPHIVLMRNYDGNAIYAGLKDKINTGKPLEDKDILNLLFLPLMRNSIPRYELAEASLEIAKTIPERAKREACIVSAYAFASKYLSEIERTKLLEVLKMCDLLERYVAERIEEGIEERIKEMLEEKYNIVAKSMLRDKSTVDFVARHFNLDIKTVQNWKYEVENE